MMMLHCGKVRGVISPAPPLYSHHVRGVDFHLFGGYLRGNFLQVEGVTRRVIDLVETFEGSAADGTHGLCHLIVGDGIGLFFHVVTDVTCQAFTAIAAPQRSALIYHDFCPVQVLTLEGCHGIAVKEHMVPTKVGIQVLILHQG